MRSEKVANQAHLVLPAVLTVLLALASLPSNADRKAELDWRSDPMMISLVTISGKSISLREICAQLDRQTSAEFNVDRRFAESAISIQASAARLETVMTCVEEVTGLQWRLVDDIFFLTKDARGTAVARWEERYGEARKTEIARTVKTAVSEWLYDTMPFPPSFDPEWELTPLQREQIAYDGALTVATMTRSQLEWLNSALLSKGFKPRETWIPSNLLVTQAPRLGISMTAAMVIDSPSGRFMVESPLTAVPTEPDDDPTTPEMEPRTVTVNVGEPTKEASLPDHLYGIWLTDEKPGDLTALFETAKERNFENVFVPVIRRGQAIYPSRVLTIGEPGSGDEDRLAALIRRADEHGIKVHAVVDATLWGDASHPPPPPARFRASEDRNLLDRTYAEQSKWQQSASAELGPSNTAPESPETEVYLCPASSQTARLLRSVVREIASKYDIAGVCLDRVEYARSGPFVVNGRDMSVPFGYTVEVRKEMIRAHQVDPIDVDSEGARSPEDLEAQAIWDRFRRGKLTGLIGETGTALKAIKPDAVFSVTLDFDSDAQSPGRWAQLPGVGAVLPEVRLGATDLGHVAEHPDVQSVNALYAAASKYAAVVPLLRDGGDMARLLELIPVISPQQPERGWIFYGGSSELVKTLEAFMSP